MRIGVNALFLIPGEVGGTETYLCELLGAFVREYPEDEYIIFCNRENLWRFGELGEHVRRVPCRVRARFRPGRLLYEQLIMPVVSSRQKIDVLWSPGYTMPIFAGCASLATIPDLQYMHFPEDFSAGALLATRMLVSLSCRFADRIVTISQNSAKELTALRGVSPERITVAYGGVSPAYFERMSEAQKDSILTRHGVTRPFLLTISNSYPHKNLDALARAYKLIEDQTACSLIIVGRPRRGESALHEARRQLRDRNRIIRLEGLSTEELRGLYQAAELFLFPTLFEGFGLPVVEAMASGVPVLCSKIPTLCEVAGDAAEYFDPRNDNDIAESMIRLLSDKFRREQLTVKGIARARRFTWENAAHVMKQAFAAAAKPGR